MDTTALDQRYRKLVLALAPVLSVGLISLSDSLTNGQRLGVPLAWAQAVVAICGAAGVYLPRNPAAKFASALAGGVGAVLIAALTDSHVSTAEFLQVAIAFMTVIAVGVTPNSPLDPAASIAA